MLIKLCKVSLLIGDLLYSNRNKLPFCVLDFKKGKLKMFLKRNFNHSLLIYFFMGLPFHSNPIFLSFVIGFFKQFNLIYSLTFFDLLFFIHQFSCFFLMENVLFYFSVFIGLQQQHNEQT